MPKNNINYLSYPLRQKTIMSLFNFETPPLENARVLEIGCNKGINILNFAIANPSSECIGIDPSQEKIENGRKIIEHLEVNNLTLHNIDLLNYNNELGKFDYIILNDIFAYENNEVKEKLLKIIKEALSDNGCATISYETYPGWKRHEVLKDFSNTRLKLTQNHNKNLSDDEKINLALGVLEFIEKNSNLNSIYKKEAKDILDSSNFELTEYILKDHKPIYFRDFEKMLQKQGLAHVSDSNLFVSFPFLVEAEKTLEVEAPGDYVVKEQYYDFLTDRSSRLSLITHRENREKMNISRNIEIKILDKIYMRKKINKDDLNLSEDKDVLLILEYLNKIFPDFISIEEIVNNFKNIDKNKIYSILGELIFLDITTFSCIKPKINYMDYPKIKEEYIKYFKYLLETENVPFNIQSFTGENLNIDYLEATILSLFDGTKSREEIIEYLLETEINNNFDIEDKRKSITSLVKLCIKFSQNYLLN